MSSQNKIFARISTALFIVIVFLSITGERTLFLFDGDIEKAGKFYKVLFCFLGGLAGGFLLPVLLNLFFNRVRRVIPDSPERKYIGQAMANEKRISYLLMAASIALFTIASYQIYLNG